MPSAATAGTTLQAPQVRREGVQVLAEDTWAGALRAAFLLHAVFLLLDLVEGLSRRVLQDLSHHITHSSPDRLDGSSGLAALITFAVLTVSPDHLFLRADVFTVHSLEASLAGGFSFEARLFSATRLFSLV